MQPRSGSYRLNISSRTLHVSKTETSPLITSMQARLAIEHLLEFDPTVNFNWVLSLSTPELIVGIWSKHCFKHLGWFWHIPLWGTRCSGPELAMISFYLQGKWWALCTWAFKRNKAVEKTGIIMSRCSLRKTIIKRRFKGGKMFYEICFFFNASLGIVPPSARS